MITDILNYNPLFLEGGQWVQVIIFGLFIYTRYRRWDQLRGISMGHNYLGLVVLIVLAIGLILMMFGPNRLTLLRILIYSALAVWELFSYTYHNKLGIPDEELHIQPIAEPVPSQQTIVLPWRRVINYLYEEPDPNVYWTSPAFRSIALWIGFGLLAAFGLNRTITMYTNGFQDGIKTALKKQKETEQKTKQDVEQAVSTAVASATVAVEKVAQSITYQQTVLSNKFDTNAKNSAARAAAIRKDLLRNRKLQPRTILQFNTPTARPLPQTSFPLPSEKVKPVPLRRSRSVSYEEDEQDWYEPQTDSLLAKRRE